MAKQYFYTQIDHGTPDDNEVVRLTVEDTINAHVSGMYRTVYGLNNAGRKLREVRITDPIGTPKFWCESWKFVNDSGAKRHRVQEYRTPAARNVSTSTIDDCLNPSHNGSFTSDDNALKSTAGRIHVYEYDNDGSLTWKY